MWNYPLSRLLTLLYTEREKTVIIPVFYFTGDCGEKERGDKGNWETRERSEMRETGASVRSDMRKTGELE